MIHLLVVFPAYLQNLLEHLVELSHCSHLSVLCEWKPSVYPVVLSEIQLYLQLRQVYLFLQDCYALQHTVIIFP